MQEKDVFYFYERNVFGKSEHPESSRLQWYILHSGNYPLIMILQIEKNRLQH